LRQKNVVESFKMSENRQPNDEHLVSTISTFLYRARDELFCWQVASKSVVHRGNVELIVQIKPCTVHMIASLARTRTVDVAQ
jgi:hypothetical protein